MAKINILIAGAGKIGALIACLLQGSEDYQVYVMDVNFDNYDIKRTMEKFPEIKCLQANISDYAATEKLLAEYDLAAVVSCLPYFLNPSLARLAVKFNMHYFDLTEDTSSTEAVAKMAMQTDKAFVPQCGLAPGFISIAANELMQKFEKFDHVKLRVGALPQHSTHALQYALTWSTEGLINEYGNPCQALEDHQLKWQQPLDGLEPLQIDGDCYEAFNTSGGLGSLGQTYRKKVPNMDYKTIRYPGHCQQMRLLMNDLKLNDDRDTLKQILERALPKSYQDVVLVYVSVIGWRNSDYVSKNYVKKIYPHVFHDLKWSAIQTTTASGVCMLVDQVLQDQEAYHGLVLQEQFDFNKCMQNRFGKIYGA